MFDKYNIIVVGAGHAGCEAAAAASNMGSKVLLITMNMGVIAQMSCNPAMGGIAKGQIVREIDALGGYSGIITDKSAIQFKMLNKSKGPAMWSPRAQNDRMRFAEEWRIALEKTPNVDFYQEMVSGLLIEGNKVTGIRTSLGIEIRSKAVVLTNGTFLNGLIHIGDKQFGGGRAGEKAATGITEQLVALGFESGRMKTGTPPRVDGRSLDYSVMIPQPGDTNPDKFSYLDTQVLSIQRDCHMSHTSTLVHDLLREGFDRSPMFNGRIKSIGPRYCPSIEDKINRFADKDSHQIFIEPEGLTTHELYPNGISTSLPFDIQLAAVRSIAGLENAHITRPGYAIEYDFFNPQDLQHTLETKQLRNLWFAGQINGTTGYEEAGAQGLLAGGNAALRAQGKDGWYPSRDLAYIGVLVDDLITMGTREPYRMFTSRAEYRLILREDNADLRLTEIGRELGLVDDERWAVFSEKREAIERERQRLSTTWVHPGSDKSGIANRHLGSPIQREHNLAELLRRPEIEYHHIVEIGGQGVDNPQVAEQVEIQVKYEGYISRQLDEIEKLRKHENTALPADLDYDTIAGLSNEIKQKLKEIRPQTLAQASRIPGVTPAAVSLLLIHLKKRSLVERESA